MVNNVCSHALHGKRMKQIGAPFLAFTCSSCEVSWHGHSICTISDMNRQYCRSNCILPFQKHAHAIYRDFYSVIWLCFPVLSEECEIMLYDLNVVPEYDTRRWHLSRPMGKPTICICENKGADQLRS